MLYITCSKLSSSPSLHITYCLASSLFFYPPTSALRYADLVLNLNLSLAPLLSPWLFIYILLFPQLLHCCIYIGPVSSNSTLPMSIFAHISASLLFYLECRCSHPLPPYLHTFSAHPTSLSTMISSLLYSLHTSLSTWFHPSSSINQGISSSELHFSLSSSST